MFFWWRTVVVAKLKLRLVVLEGMRLQVSGFRYMDCWQVRRYAIRIFEVGLWIIYNFGCG